MASKVADKDGVVYLMSDDRARTCCGVLFGFALYELVDDADMRACKYDHVGIVGNRTDAIEWINGADIDTMVRAIIY